MATILFFDDYYLNRRDNVVRKIAKPELIKESVYVDPYVNTHWGYPTVFRDEMSGKWRMLYQGLNQGEPTSPLLAESDDGLRWAPRDTTKDIDLPERKFPHQILPLDHFTHWSNCYIDPLAEPAERIKGFVVWKKDTYLWVSPDGIQWTLKEGVKWRERKEGPHAAAFWNTLRNSYVLMVRTYGSRRISVSETRDWINFTKPELALQADALDTPLAELYGTHVFPYEGYYIGLLWVYHPAPQVEGHSPNKFWDGRVDCQLVYSLNGWHFQRGLRDSFIPNGDPGKPDSGCVYPSSIVAKEDGSLWIYASACTHEHGYIPPGSGSLVAYRLPQGGFVYLESGGGAGTIGTRALHWKSNEVELNIQSQGGEARAQITDPAGVVLKGYSFDDCPPFSGNDRAWKPVWKNGKTIQTWSGKAIRVEVELKSARLFAIGGDFVPLIGRHQKDRLKSKDLMPNAGIRV